MDVAFASLERGRKQGKNGRDRLVLTITGYVSQLIDELNCCVVLMEEQALEPEDRAKLVRQRDRFERALRALVKEGIEDGSVVPCDPKLAIFVILGAMNWVAEMVQAERRMEAAADHARAQPDIRAHAVLGAGYCTCHRCRNASGCRPCKSSAGHCRWPNGVQVSRGRRERRLQKNKSRRKVMKAALRLKSGQSQGDTRPSR